MVIVLDYGVGNTASVINMVKKAGGHAKLSADPDEVLTATHLILPGVGAFDHGMKSLRASGLDEPLLEAASRGAQVLGICLGMQMLGLSSDEGDEAGLSLIDARFKRFEFDASSKLRVPHVGWNTVDVSRAGAVIPPSADGEQRFYFVHSYYAICDQERDILAKCHYGHEFAAAYQRDNVVGVQFHPEKSHRFGLALFEQFLLS